MVMKSDKKVGVYVCQCGGNISDVIDTAEVVKALATYPNVKESKEYIFMCSAIGQSLIEEDIKSGKVDRVIVASCTPKLHKETFRTAIKRVDMNPYLYEHVNIREQGSWSHSHDPRGATEKAKQLIKAAINRVIDDSFLELSAIKVPVRKNSVVIGGGIAGLRAARDLSLNGIHVDIIESTPYLGGRVALFEKVYPTKENVEEFLGVLINEVINDKNITVHYSTELQSVSGHIGDFKLKLTKKINCYLDIDKNVLNQAIELCPQNILEDFTNNGLKHKKAIYSPYPNQFPQKSSIIWDKCNDCGACKSLIPELNQKKIVEILELNAGAIILATGFRHYIPFSDEFGFNNAKSVEYPTVITLPQFIRMLSKDGIFSKSLIYNNKEIKSIAFIHCVGSRQLDGINEPQEDGLVNEYCSRVCCTATLKNANEVKERFPKVKVYDLYRDIRTYGRYHEERYYEVASKNGVVFIRFNGEEPPVISVDESKKVAQIKIIDLLSLRDEITFSVDLVVLAVGMIPHESTKTIADILKIPTGADRFLLEIHPKLKPVETANNGILLAGTAQAPMDITETVAGASAAASKVAILLSRPDVEIEPYIAKVDPTLCLGPDCGKCISQCGYPGVIKMIDVEIYGESLKRAKVNEVLCKGCGACVAECPTKPRAIEVVGYNISQFNAMIDGFIHEQES